MKGVPGAAERTYSSYASISRFPFRRLFPSPSLLSADPPRVPSPLLVRTREHEKTRSRIISATKRPASRDGPSNVGLIQNRCRHFYTVPIGSDNALDHACLPRGERFTLATFTFARARLVRLETRAHSARARIIVAMESAACQDDSGTCRCSLVSELMQPSSMKGPIALLFSDVGKLRARSARDC